MAPRPEDDRARRKHAGVGREGLRDGEGLPADDPEASAGVGYGGLDEDAAERVRERDEARGDRRAGAGRAEAPEGQEDEPGEALYEDPVDQASFDSMDASDPPSSSMTRVGPAKRAPRDRER